MIKLKQTSIDTYSVYKIARHLDKYQDYHKQDKYRFEINDKVYVIFADQDYYSLCGKINPRNRDFVLGLLYDIYYYPALTTYAEFWDHQKRKETHFTQIKEVILRGNK